MMKYTTDKYGNRLDFRTLTDYVSDSNGVSLQTKLDNIDQSLSETVVPDKISNGIYFDEDTNELRLLSDDEIISTTTINRSMNISFPPGNVSGISYSKSLSGNNLSLLLKWINPPVDATYQDMTLSTWAGTKITYRTDRYPAYPEDGTLAANITDHSIGSYTVNNLNPTVYYFAFFPYSTDGNINTNADNRVLVHMEATIYGFHINNSDSNPSTCVTYLDGCDNYGFTPASMNYSTGTFNWGSWSDTDFFVPRPCVLGYDGTVQYYLDPTNYTKKADGTSAVINNVTNTPGNVMMEWGRDGKRIYYKFVTSGTDAGYECTSTSPNVYISDTQVDSGYRCWSFYDANNNLKDHFYTACYNVYKDSSNRLRSVSGYTATDSLTGTNEITYAKNNGSGWYIGTYGDVILINMLLVMLGKSLDTQSVYGQGNTNSSSYIGTGNLNSKGLFWGSSGTTSTVKVFGMENYWGNYYKRIAGYVTDASYNQLVKLTPNNVDGTAVTAYNTNGAGYFGMGNYDISSSKYGYVKSWAYHSRGIMTIKTDDINSTGTGTSAYYCDRGYVGASYYALQGGYRSNGSYCGAFYLSLYTTVSNSNSNTVGSLSFR